MKNKNTYPNTPDYEKYMKQKDEVREKMYCGENADLNTHNNKNNK